MACVLLRKLLVRGLVPQSLFLGPFLKLHEPHQDTLE